LKAGERARERHQVKQTPKQKLFDTKMSQRNAEDGFSDKITEPSRLESVPFNDANASLVNGHVTSFEIDRSDFLIENLAEKPHGKTFHKTS
jgi:hypothetical protein